MRPDFPDDPTTRIPFAGEAPPEVPELLGFGPTIGVLTHTALRLSPPAAVGLFGPWGSGKSTLLHHLHRRLREESDQPIVLSLNPWAYESERSPLRALVWALRAEAEVLLPDEVETTDWDALLDLAIAVTPAIAGLAAGVPFTPVGVGALAATGKGAASVAGKVRGFLSRRGVDGGSLGGRPPVDLFRLALEQVMLALVDSQSPEAGPKRRVVVLVDDLDRCLPGSMLSLLQAMKLIFCADGRSPVVFVCALDRGQVVAALRGHYDQFDSVDAERFLEKIFDATVFVPDAHEARPEALVALLRSRVGLVDPELVALMGPGWDGLKKLVRAKLFNNPRMLHRLGARLTQAAAVVATLDEDQARDALAAGILDRDGVLSSDALLLLALSGYDPAFRPTLLHRSQTWGVLQRLREDHGGVKVGAHRPALIRAALDEGLWEAIGTSTGKGNKNVSTMLSALAPVSRALRGVGL